jgi:hypothetical protein
MMNKFYQETPSESRMFACPACQEIVSVGATSCRYCGIPIDESTATRLNAEFQRVSDAVASANTFKQSILVAVLLTVVSPIYLFGFSGRQPNPRFFLASAAPIGFLAYAISWQRKYGKLETRDKEYPEALRAMRLMLLVWAAALLIQVGVLAFALS